MLNGTLPTKYRGPRCMARYLKAHPDANAQLFVTDYNTGALLNATTVGRLNGNTNSARRVQLAARFTF